MHHIATTIAILTASLASGAPEDQPDQHRGETYSLFSFSCSAVGPVEVTTFIYPPPKKPIPARVADCSPGVCAVRAEFSPEDWPVDGAVLFGSHGAVVAKTGEIVSMMGPCVFIWERVDVPASAR